MSAPRTLDQEGSILQNNSPESFSFPLQNRQGFSPIESTETANTDSLIDLKRSIPYFASKKTQNLQTRSNSAPIKTSK